MWFLRSYLALGSVAGWEVSPASGPRGREMKTLLKGFTVVGPVATWVFSSVALLVSEHTWLGLSVFFGPIVLLLTYLVGLDLEGGK